MKKIIVMLCCAAMLCSFSSAAFAAQTTGTKLAAKPDFAPIVGVKVAEGSKAAESQKSAAPSVSISTTEIDPGETLKLTFTGVKDISTYTVQNNLDFAVKISKLGTEKGKYFAFLPVSYNTAAGTYTATVKSSELSGGKTTFTIKVKDKKFYEQWLTVDKKVADSTINNDEASKEFRRVIWPQKEKYDDNKYFDGALIMPITGRLTTEFGSRRLVNGVPSFRHDGLDLANATGTPIKAAQNGKVLYSGFVTLTGHTIVIEHGMGLKTWYEHMSKRNVNEGDMVKTGDIIGEVGATGFVTGPHLHFSASINGVYINPYTLVDSKFLDLL